MNEAAMSALGEDLFAPGFKDTPYWWDAAPPERAVPRAPPPRADVASVGVHPQKPPIRETGGPRRRLARVHALIRPGESDPAVR